VFFKKKSVLFHTEASIDQAHGLLESKTLKASAMPDHPVETLKDTVRLDGKPFRGEIGATDFKLTRRRRGRQVRVAVEGKLKAKEQGGTEIQATMSAPKTLVAGLVGGVLGLGVIAAGALLGDLPGWVPLLMLGAEIPAVAIAARLYERETSATFSALRDAIPEHPPQAVAPISNEVAAPAEVGEKVR
jgi:hypothetical protein